MTSDIEYVPPTFTRKPFQREDLLTLRMRNASGNFSDMGCFKTSTLLFLIQDLKLENILIVTTRTGKIAYQDALPAILPDHDVYDIVGRNEPPQINPRPGRKAVFLTHYGQYTGTSLKTASGVAQWARTFEWDMVACDESHHIKNRKAQCTKQITYIKARYKHVMSGTPYINDPSEIWAQIHFLDNSIPGYWPFRNYFCEVDDFGDYSKVIGLRQDRRQQFKDIIYGFAVRRTKREVFPDLPEKIPYPPIKVPLNPTQRRMYNEIKNELETLDAQGTQLSSPTVLALFTRLRQIADATPEVIGQVWNDKDERYELQIELTEPSSKIDALVELLQDIPDKVVIFTQYVGMAKLVKARLESLKKPYDTVWLQQADTDDQRAVKVRTFQSPGGPRIFLTTLQLGSEAITLTAADTVIMLDRSWSPKDNSQAVDRVHRPGQDKPVAIYFIEGEATIDGYIRSKVNTKMGWFKQVFNVDSYSTFGAKV